MHEWLSGTDDHALGLRVWGKLTTDEYQDITGRMERELLSNEKINVLLEIGDLEGMEPGAIWEDLKFDTRHFRDIKRFAVVGDSTAEKWMTTLSKPFTSGDARFFTPEETDKAWAWVKE